MQSSENKETHPPIFVVSGGKGLAGDSVVQSILIQFPNNMIPVIIKPDVLTIEKVQEAVEQACVQRALLYTPWWTLKCANYLWMNVTKRK